MNARAAFVALGLLLAATGSRAEDAPWMPDQTNVTILARDGKALAADVFLPAKPGRYPAVVVQTPYNRALNRTALTGMSGQRLWDREHYVYVIVDWRGFFGSCGDRCMAQTSAHLFDHVIPHVPVHQWVLSLLVPCALRR